jgi:hypothetical protein
MLEWESGLIVGSNDGKETAWLGTAVGLTFVGAGIEAATGSAVLPLGVSMGNDVGNSVMSIAGIPVGAGVGLADRFIGDWMGAMYGELEGNAPTGEPAGRLLGGKLEAVMGAVGFTPIGSFVAPIGAGLMLGTFRRGAAAGMSVGAAVGKT